MSPSLTSSPSPNLQPDQWDNSHRDYLLSVAIARLRNRALAEDLVQDTFLAAWKARSSFQGKSAERTWLTRILMNKIADHYRRMARRPSVNLSQFDGDQTDEEILDNLHLASEGADARDPAPSLAAEHSEFLDHLERALDRIPSQSAEAFRMREIQGLSTDDIVQRLDITPNHLWVLIHRAKKSLRRELESLWSASDTAIVAVNPAQLRKVS